MNLIDVVGYECDALEAKARLIASRLNISLEKDANPCLFVGINQLSIKTPQFSLLSADFSYSTWIKRKNEGKKQGLVRACKPSLGLKILDATAGWGRDAAVLASFGAEVLLLERHPVMALLLEDALMRQDDAEKNHMKLTLLAQDTHAYIKHLKEADYPDVIYIDPMHPERQKSALVKKDMQLLQQMIGPDADVLDLIELAISRVKQRVVVKWPQKMKPLWLPSYSINGKTIRFDVYSANH